MDREDCLMATKAEKLHMQKMVEFGCVVCRWYCEEDDLPPCNIHHIRDHTGMGMKDAEIISQELDGNMQPILKVRIKDVNMGDPVVAEFRSGGWVVDMD